MSSWLIFQHHRHLTGRDAFQEKGEVLKVLVPQGDLKEKSRGDLSNEMPRKASGYTKVPVPETDTGGWVEYTQARE